MQAAAPKARPVGELSVCKGKEPEMTFARGLREGEGALEGARGPTRNGCLSCELRPYHPEIIPGTAGRSSDHEGTKTTPPPLPRNSVPNVAATGRAPGADRTAAPHRCSTARSARPGTTRIVRAGTRHWLAACRLVRLRRACWPSWIRLACSVGDAAQQRAGSLLFPTDWVGRLQNWRPAAHCS